MAYLRKRLRRRGQDTDIDMTPMLDIVFIMLIFFIITSVFLSERGIDLRSLPDDGHPPPNRSIQVDLRANGSVIIEGDQLDIQSVPARVQVLRAANPSRNVLLLADYKSALEQVVFLKDEFELAAIPVSLKVRPKNQ